MFKNLQAKFDSRTEFPIEIDEICAALVEMGYQDKISVSPEEMNTDELLGTYAQWTEHGGVYGEPILVSMVVYPSNIGLFEQRVICAKELVHLCDARVTKSNTEEEILELATVLSSRNGASEGMPITSLKVASDVVAQSKGLMLLFPKAARIIAREKIATNAMTIQELSEKIQMPINIIEDMLEEEWEEMAELVSII